MNGFQKKIIKKALENEDKLSARECDFIESISELPDDYELTEKQNAWLNDIQQKVY